MRLRQLFEAPRTAVMAFGRMNPPTIGHAKLVDAVKSQGGDPYIFLSQSQKPKTDPLAFQDKLRYAKFFFPEVTIGHPEVKTIIQALQKVEQLGYENLIYVAGSDRVDSFNELINKYNGKDYNFKSIKVVSAGERDPDADGAEGMSASKMRAAAAEGDLESFKQGVPNQEVADEMFAAVRQGMGVKDTVTDEDLHPNERPEGPELKPTMPSGTIRVKVSDVYDWYKLGMHISDLANLDKNDFGEGPPEAVIAFGSEEEEHKYIKLLQKLGLEILDVDPGAADAPGVDVDPRYNTK